MAKQFISEAQRMQKLANMPISEMALPEMARTAGTGGAYTITEKGEEILKQAKASGAAPEGIKNSELAALVFLFKAKKDGKRVQKIDYAKERNVPQPAVNPIFNSLEVKELISKEGYTSKQQEPKTSRPRPDVDAMLGDLDIEEAKKTSASKEDKIQVIKEWIWFTCDEGKAKDDITKYNKMVDDYFADKEDVAKEDFKNIWSKVSEKYGVGDVGADSEDFSETWKDVQTGNLVNPGRKY